jgi:hypothetical protein
MPTDRPSTCRRRGVGLVAAAGPARPGPRDPGRAAVPGGRRPPGCRRRDVVVTVSASVGDVLCPSRGGRTGSGCVVAGGPRPPGARVLLPGCCGREVVAVVSAAVGAVVSRSSRVVRGRVGRSGLGRHVVAEGLRSSGVPVSFAGWRVPHVVAAARAVVGARLPRGVRGRVGGTVPGWIVVGDGLWLPGWRGPHVVPAVSRPSRGVPGRTARRAAYSAIRLPVKASAHGR